MEPILLIIACAGSNMTEATSIDVAAVADWWVWSEIWVYTDIPHFKLRKGMRRVFSLTGLRAERLYIYFSGHGIVDHFLLGTQTILQTDLLKLLDGTRDDERVAVFDCCHLGHFTLRWTLGETGFQLRNFDFDNHLRLQSGWLIFTASDENLRSITSSITGSLYTQAWLKAVQTAKTVNGMYEKIQTILCEQTDFKHPIGVYANGWRHDLLPSWFQKRAWEIFDCEGELEIRSKKN